MDIEQTRLNLKRLVDEKSVIDAQLLFAAYEGDSMAFIKLTLGLPSAAGREPELTHAAREAAGFPTIRVIVEYVAGGEARHE